MGTEPKRQHYIPQFIIKRFCKSDGKVYYYDKGNNSIKQKSPKQIFEENNLYKYLYKNEEDPNIIEKDLSKFESDAARLIEPFRKNCSVGLSYDDNESLKYFLFIMMFRSKYMTATYSKDIFNHNKKCNLSAEEMDEFYKQNLGRLVKCRSLEEAITDDKIDKQFIRYAVDIVFGNTDKHLVLFAINGETEFILGDVYPTGMGQIINRFMVPSLTCLVYPISCNRAIALVDTYSELHGKLKQLKIKNIKWYKEPKKFGQGYLIECNYLTDDFVVRINKSIFDGSLDGVCFKNGETTGLPQLNK